MRESLGWIADELAALDQKSLRRKLVHRESPLVAGQVQIADQQLINFGSNDYLGLSADSRLVDAVKIGAGHAGWGAAASPAIHGRGVYLNRLELELAKFEGAQAALVFTSGYAANVGVLTSLVGRGDTIFSDALNHASLIDGCRLSRAEVKIFDHLSAKDLKEKVENCTGQGRKLIVTDSLFSMEGDIPPLAEYCEIARSANCMLMLDEAHATGVFGETGTGIAEFLGLGDQIDIRVGTLSKALGSTGGFVSGSQQLIDWISNRARSYVYSTAPPEAISCAAIASLEIIRKEPCRREKVLQLASSLRDQLTQNGFDIGTSTSQIVPIYLGNPNTVIEYSSSLRKQGIFVPAIRPPSVPVGKSLLRVSLSCDHSSDQIELLVQKLVELRDSHE